jgi:hypothetical protein
MTVKALRAIADGKVSGRFAQMIGGNELTWSQEWPGGVCPSVQEAGSTLLRLGGQLKGNEVCTFTQAESTIRQLLLISSFV